MKFDAKEWVRIAKDAGMKYIVITSKHHDGFAIYNSQISAYDIVDATPYRRDPLKELAAEAKRHGLKLCFFYSILDWHYLAAYVDAPGKDPTAGNSATKLKPQGKDEYLKYMKEQLRELITNYDPGVLWFDGEWQANSGRRSDCHGSSTGNEIKTPIIGSTTDRLCAATN